MNDSLPSPSIKKWYQVALFNLVVLALLGLLLRYKINFPLPMFRQENLLHAHSHFAFNGWISFLLQVIILNEFTPGFRISPKFWNRFFLVSTVVNYGMIVSFALVGYAPVSIILSVIGLLLSYAFTYKIYKALPAEDSKKVSGKFVKGSLVFLVLSSAGTYVLAVLMSSKNVHEYSLHNALYFFLHFQYNGWFTFAVLAFLFKKLEAVVSYNVKHARNFFILLAVTCVPSYFFTALFRHRPLFLTIIIIITALLQVVALVYLWKLLSKNRKTVFENLPVIIKWIYSLAISAFILKVLLQFFSVQPQLAQIAFGSRPIIIGYLHLIFLAFISMYLLGFLADKKVVSLDYKISSIGLVMFAAGIIINEGLLAMQGFAAIYYLYLPWLNIALFANTFTLVAGAALLFMAACKRVVNPAGIDPKHLIT